MIDTDAVRDRHPILEVLDRLGVEPPARWNGHSQFTIACPLPEHEDRTPSCRIHPENGWFHCFGCGVGGDVIDLVRHALGLRAFGDAVAWLETGRPVPLTTPVAVPAVAPVPAVSRERIIEINAAAWDLLTTPARAAVAVAYLRHRGIDIDTVAQRAGSDTLAGYPPPDPAGLTRELTDRGYDLDGLVAAGWTLTRDDGTVRDRFHRRVLFPLRDTHGDLLGVTGRDRTGRSTAKYLNTPTTAAYRKSEVFYQPLPAGAARGAEIIVCEGLVDALALAGYRDGYPMALCGTAMTPHHAETIAALRPARVTLAPDGDTAGQRALESWTTTLLNVGVVPTVAPSGPEADPATINADHCALRL